MSRFERQYNFNAMNNPNNVSVGVGLHRELGEGDCMNNQQNKRRRSQPSWNEYRFVADNVTHRQQLSDNREYAFALSFGVKNYNKLINLFLYGIDSGYVFKNRDGFDLSIQNIFADIFCGNPEEMDRAFRRSALWSWRWEDPTYRDRTMLKAIMNYRRKLYKRQSVWRSRV